ncbi:16S rRNA (guanine(527)-N(7))-methyltransferase RsmG [Thetidibacter halocola]|uniref:Ribosomal RNA small subunit methyltransferase G n=1 Tax=Thetidibacter halocola TaxID=2827239 RepID=A0A8J7WE50_9RHOB|nr:16S rRNA (guanine(527)-N(7))-methyltransferase RsmG [Thetidibacter halocola]MBS0123463.1 16S rRNA (guanine(527)-N(7))-methyltransferase RsmG [Thetidibacter halocola]
MHDVLRELDVSRETSERLARYADLLEKWSQKINLVSPTTLSEADVRHFADSAQLLTLVHPENGKWVDLGSGAGFPGLVVATIAAERHPALHVIMIESDQRKCVFLRTVIRELGLEARVLTERIERVEPQQAQYISARALAPLDDLLPLVHRHCAPGCVALLPKGATWKKEVEKARGQWRFSLASHKSRTDPGAVILEIGDIAHA